MKNQAFSIRSMCLSGLIALAMLVSISAFAQDGFDRSSLVVVKVQDLTNSQYGELSSALAPVNQYSLEYTCLQSGIIVLRYYHNFTTKGYVNQAVKSDLRRYGKLNRIEVVFVDISAEASTQC
ncbi:MAG: hypothetical protein AAF944_15615 [Bacteroidota bacterium]